MGGEFGTSEACEPGRFVDRAEALGVAEGHAGGDAGTGGAPVYFGIGEDADVFGGGGCGFDAIGEDGAIEEGEVGIVRVVEGDGCADGFGEGGGGIDEVAEGGVSGEEAELAGVGDGVEGPAIGDIAEDLSVAGEGDFVVGGVEEGGDALEGDLAGITVLDFDFGADEPAGAFDIDFCDGFLFGDEAVIDGVATEGDDSVSAHGAVAFVVHEEDGEVGFGEGGFDEDGPVHVGVSAGLEHEEAAEVVEVIADVAAFGEDGRAGDVGVA